MSDAFTEEILVSAIVSVYNSERFIRGLMEDLLNQSLYQKGLLEIIVVDTASKQDEASIVKACQQSYRNITYIRTEDRKTVYGAWNIGIKAAKGRCITNANTDDRHSPIALEKMALCLDSMPEVVLVYADVYVTEKPNETFDESDKSKRYYWYDWDRHTLLEKGCFIGPQPMWRRSVHEEYGYFDESLVVSGDAEFWLRISQTHNFYHIKEPLGLYLKSPDSIEHSNQALRDYENLKIINAYREAHRTRQLIRVKPKGGIMDTVAEMISVILVSSDDERYQAMIEMIQAFTEGQWESHRVEVANGDDGFAASLNRALSRCKGQYIALIEDSVILTDSALNHLSSHIKGTVSVVSPVTNQRISANHEPYSDMDGLRAFAYSYRERNLNRVIPTRSVFSSCLVFNQEMLSKTGPFDERFVTLKASVEDLCLRAMLKGCSLIIAGDVYTHCSSNNRANTKDIGALQSKWSAIKASSDIGRQLLSIEAVQEAHRLFQQGSINGAVKRLFDYINMLPEDTNLRGCLLEILLYGSKYEDVIKIADMLNTSEDKIALFKCKALVATGRINEAESLLSIIDGDPAEKMNLLGVIAMKKARDNDAEALFQRAISLNPSAGEPYRNIGLLQFSKGKKTSGFKNIEKAFILEPFNQRSAETYHLLVSSERLYSRAETTFKEALQVLPNCRQSLLFLIDCLLKQDKFHEAMDAIERLLKDFGYDEQTLEMALKVRGQIGPIDSTDRENSISLCMIVKDEEANLPTCLASVKPVIDEMIVVDTGSKDRTKTIAAILGAKVYDYVWDDDFASARNLSISKANGKWILILDADEVISSTDRGLIRDIVQEGTCIYQVITRNYTFQASTLGFIENDRSYPEERGVGWTPSLKIRLFPNNIGLLFEGAVHEMVDRSAEKGGLPIKAAPFAVHHYGKLDVERDRLKGERYYQMGKDKLQRSPDDIKAMKELAIVAGGLGKVQEAVGLWQKVLAIEPTCTDALLNLAGLMMMSSDYGSAREYYERVLAIEPNNETAMKCLRATG